MELEISEMKLFNLSKKLDQCLSSTRKTMELGDKVTSPLAFKGIQKVKSHANSRELERSPDRDTPNNFSEALTRGSFHSNNIL